jgi:chromosome segregation ATPase
VREREAHKDTQKVLRDETLIRTQLVQQVADLQERLAAEEEHRQSLEEKHQNSREALAHFRQSVKEQRDQELRQHEQQVAYLQESFAPNRRPATKSSMSSFTLTRNARAWRANWRIQHQLASGKGRESVAQEGAG